MTRKIRLELKEFRIFEVWTRNEGTKKPYANWSWITTKFYNQSHIILCQDFSINNRSLIQNQRFIREFWNRYPKSDIHREIFHSQHPHINCIPRTVNHQRETFIYDGWPFWPFWLCVWCLPLLCIQQPGICCRFRGRKACLSWGCPYVCIFYTCSLSRCLACHTIMERS